MSSMSFALLMLLLFGAIFSYESGQSGGPRIRPFGLFGWLASGNWPAKVGAGLLVIGIGALLRYVLLNVDVPPQLKLGGGVLLATLLGGAAAAIRARLELRAIHLALAGAAFGVAYLTAYSAYGFFGYINDVNALALLALVAVAAGLFAVASEAMSVAMLAMLGAYVAPKFAIGAPGPLAVYGYYLAASALTLAMVALRGWRALIHLSFLFTLAGALFFGWSGKFYQPEYYASMQPLLLALTAVHLAMPLFERNALPGGAPARVDIAYFLALPLVAAGLTLAIAPLIALQGALGLGALALLWAAAGALLSLQGRSGAARHWLMASLLGVAAVLCVAQDVPWTLLGLGLAVLALAIAPRMGWGAGMQELACALALCMAGMHIVESILQPAPAHAFLNVVALYRAIASALLAAGGILATRRAMGIGKTFNALALTWALLAFAAELSRLQIDCVPQLLYALLLLLLFGLALCGRAGTFVQMSCIVLSLALVASGWWAAADAAPAWTGALLLATALVLLAPAWRQRAASMNGGADIDAALALALLPFALMPWAAGAGRALGQASPFFGACIVVGGALLAALAARAWLAGSPNWDGALRGLHYLLAAGALLVVTLFHIERGVWPVAFELLTLAYLAGMTRFGRGASTMAGLALAVGAVLVLQAMLLRVLGPDRVMSAADIGHIHLPAIVSLMWALFGAAVAFWGAQTASRPVWSCGAVLLVAAAVKLVLFDFGSLGQLENILALIAAGLVFLAVAWRAPMPPSQPPAPDGAVPAAGN
ncbi:MAG: DUF2339 domain-containing protein [Pseudomonadota bacterium]